MSARPCETPHRMRPVDQHRAGEKEPIRVAIVTVSDTRTEATDESGALAAELVTKAGHVVSERALVRDEPSEVRREVLRLLGDASVVVTNGGTGIAARDSSYEAIVTLLEKRLDGFGELFRSLSYAEVGAAAMMSRAIAGTVATGGVVVALPGSPDAVRLGLEKIVLPELGHLAKLGRRPSASRADASEPRAPSHLDAGGKAKMVDVGDKAVTTRVAEAQAIVSMSAEALRHVAEGTAPKGDVLSVARIAGIQAAKRTAELVPLCHPIALTSVDVDFEVEPNRVRVRTTARTNERTGVEMEALVAASVAALTIYDMLKAVDRSMSVGEVFLVRKTGGRHGDYVRPVR